jgi:TRAP-type C4-dicarboxylate transport system substrate-binding protein
VKKVIYCLVAVTLLAGLVLGCAPKPTPTAEQVTLKLVTFLPVKDPSMDILYKWQERVNQQSNGSINIKLVGGPEAIPTFEQMEAARKGVVDLLATASAYHSAEMPEAMSFSHSEITPAEERKVGYSDFMDKLYREKLNVTYLGRFWWPGGFTIWSNVPLKKIDDFKRVRMRVSPVYEPHAKALGMVLMSTTFAEIHTAMETGVVDCFGWPNIGPRFYGWHEVTKYIIDPMFYNQNTVFLMNLDSWNRLSKSQQKLIKDNILWMEEEMVPYYTEYGKKERQFFVDYGLKVITVDEPDRYLGIAREAAKAYTREKAPANAEKIIGMIFKK